jgi:hypothetical protein
MDDSTAVGAGCEKPIVSVLSRTNTLGEAWLELSCSFLTISRHKATCGNKRRSAMIGTISDSVVLLAEHFIDSPLHFFGACGYPHAP